MNQSTTPMQLSLFGEPTTLAPAPRRRRTSQPRRTNRHLMEEQPQLCAAAVEPEPEQAEFDIPDWLLTPNAVAEVTLAADTPPLMALLVDGRCGKCAAPPQHIQRRRWPGVDEYEFCVSCGNDGMRRHPPLHLLDAVTSAEAVELVL